MTRHRHRRLSTAANLLAVLVGLCTLDRAAGQPATRPAANPAANPAAVAAPAATGESVVDPELAAKLAAPYQAAVDGKPLRELLNQIAEAAGFNLWIDRNVDPDRLVSLTGGQKTLFASLVEAARAADADAIAVGNVVLVGQPERVQQLAGALLALSKDGRQRSGDGEKKSAVQPEIRWPRATTPTEALRITAGQTAAELPHDHWPEVAWRDISPQVATLLVTSQFDLMPAANGVVDSDTLPRKTLGQTRADQSQTAEPDASGDAQARFVRLAAPPLLTRRYPAGPHVEALRSAAVAADPRASLVPPRDRNAASGIELAGSPAAHVAAIAAMLTHAAPPRGQATVDIDNVRFTLNLRGAPAKDVLTQLATASGRKLQVSEQANENVRRLITFNVQDQTLRQLVKTVTDQIDASPQWSADALTITTTP